MDRTTILHTQKGRKYMLQTINNGKKKKEGKYIYVYWLEKKQRFVLTKKE
jgi:hypothetical protein